MKSVIAFASTKGGVWKTFASYNVAGALAASKSTRVLLVDMDPRGSLSSQFLEKESAPNLADVFINETPLASAAHETDFPGIAIVPSGGRKLTAAKKSLETGEDGDAHASLRDAIKELDTLYDVIILDCVHDQEMLTLNALTAATRVVIPTTLEDWSVAGLAEVVRLVEGIKTTRNPELEGYAILINAYNGRRGLERRLLESLRTSGQPVLNTVIKNIAVYQKAISDKKPISFFKPQSEEAAVFRKLVKELSHAHARAEV